MKFTLPWAFGATVVAGAAGATWLFAPVELPLIGLLVLTFLPVMELSEFFAAYLRTFTPQEKPQ